MPFILPSKGGDWVLRGTQQRREARIQGASREGAIPTTAPCAATDTPLLPSGPSLYLIVVFMLLSPSCSFFQLRGQRESLINLANRC